MTRILLNCFLIIYLLVIIATSQEHGADGPKKAPNQKRAISNNVVRTNAIPPNTRIKQKPGFFRTLFQVIGEQWTETRKTVADVNKLLDNGFLPENASPSTTPPPNLNASTTTQPFKIKRSELIALLRKNFLGIGRLVDIEVKDALEQSDRDWPEYRQNLTKAVWKYL